MTCRGVDLTQVGPDANDRFVLGILVEELKGCSMLSSTNTYINGNILPSLDGNTFTVQLVVSPKRPLKL